MSEQLRRQWVIIKNIPRHPVKIGTRELVGILQKKGFNNSQRTVQRDLNTMAEIFSGLQSDKNKDAAGWFWAEGSEIHDLPPINPPMALTLKLLETLNFGRFSSTVTQMMQPYFDRSSQVLASLPSIANTGWQDKFRVVPRNQPLLPADIPPEVMSVIYDALLKGRQLHVHYQRKNSEPTEYDLHPLGLVFRESVVYLVATLWGYQDVKQLALHRFKSCQLLDQPSNVPEGFSLDDYIQGGAFEYEICGGESIQLVALFASGAAYHLDETRLSEDQKFEPVDNEWVRVTASVKNTQQLRWWLLGFGVYVQVIEPHALRDEFKRVSEGMAEIYHHDK